MEAHLAVEITTIGIHRATKVRLDKNKAPGQCYDGFIRQLIDLWEKTGGKDWLNNTLMAPTVDEPAWSAETPPSSR